MRIPCAERPLARRGGSTGPSASGSENGKPISTRSAPPVDRGLGELGRVRPGHQVDDERLAAHRCARASVEVLVAAAREADEDELGVELRGSGERVCRLERGDDPLGLGEPAGTPRAPPRRSRAAYSRGRSPAGRRAPGRRRGSRARRRSSARRGSGRPRPRGRRARAVQDARRDPRRGSRHRPPRRRRAARPRRRGSRRTGRSRSSRRRRRRRRPRAAAPPPSRICSRASRPITRLQLAHELRVRVRARRTSRSGSGSSRRS